MNLFSHNKNKRNFQIGKVNEYVTELNNSVHNSRNSNKLCRGFQEAYSSSP